MKYQLKRSCIAIGAISFAVGILWSFNFGLTETSVPTSLPTATTEKPNELTTPSFWSQLIPIQSPTESMRSQVEASLGLSVADVSVTMERPSEKDFVIPLRDDVRPVVRITLPASWMMKRSNQLGSKEAVSESLQSIVTEIVPGSIAIIHIVQDSPVATIPVATTESYAKQITLGLGLLALLCCGTIFDRRRGEHHSIQLLQSLHSVQDAERILQMEYAEAKRTIDSLHEPHKASVLQAIITSEVLEELPVVHVQQQSSELSNCN